MNLFDNLQNAAFDVVTNTMGYSATWTPADVLISPKTAQVLYKGPSEKEKLLNADYSPDKLMLEYKQGMFPGLKESVDINEQNVIRVNGLAGGWVDFYVRSVGRLWDGNTFEARLEVKDVE